MSKVDEFIELSHDEAEDILGGMGLIAGAIIGTLVCIAGDIGNEALKNRTGKDAGDWITYGMGYVVNKVGSGLEYLGNAMQ